MRGSQVSLAEPEKVVANIKANDAKDADWSAPRVEVREVGGVRGVLVQMDSGEGDKARSTLTLKLPLANCLARLHRLRHQAGVPEDAAALRADPPLGAAGRAGRRREEAVGLRPMPVHPYQGRWPTLGARVFLAPGAHVVGDVVLGDDVSFWFHTVARGDVNSIRVGARTNIQDGTVLHVTHVRHPLVIGEGVVVGHQAVLHGCTIEDGALIGIGARVLDGAVVERGAQVGAGAVVAPGHRDPGRPPGAGHPGAGGPAAHRRRDAADRRDRATATRH